MYHQSLSEVLPNAIHDQLTRGRQLHLIDVRPAYDFEQGHPVGAISIPCECISRTEIRRRLGDEAGRDKPIYLISRHGEKAAEAARKLHAEGLTQCLLVRGGTHAWAQDYPLS
ncbi:MAG: rhodanese-like domain-containing protein [Gammaproteobacteria bacterium]